MNKRKILGLVIAGATIMSIGGISQSHIQKSNIQNNVLLAQHNNNQNTSFSEHSVDGTVIVKCDNLWINSKPAANDGNLVVVTKGTELHATAESSNGWYKVNYDGLVGWIGGEPYSKFVPASGKPQMTYKGVSEIVEVTAGGLCLNSKPEPNVGTMNILPHGAKVIATEVSSNGWYKVTYQGQTGWIGGAPYSKVVSQYRDFPTGGLKTILGKVEVTADGLCMNSKPEPNDGVITILKKGTVIPYFQMSQNGWYYVDYNGRTGWIGGTPYSKVVSQKPWLKTKPYVTVTSPIGLWLNNGPSVNSGHIECINYNTTLAVVGQKDGWYEVDYNGITGWVDGQYVD